MHEHINKKSNKKSGTFIEGFTTQVLKKLFILI